MPPPPKGACNRVAISQAQEGEQKGGGHPAVTVPRSWLTSPFRVAGLVPAPPPPPRSYTLKRAGYKSGASVRWGRTHAAGNTAAARSWRRGDIRSLSPLCSRGPAPAGAGVNSPSGMPISPSPHSVAGGAHVGGGYLCAQTSSPHNVGQVPARCQDLPPSHSPLTVEGGNIWGLRACPGPRCNHPAAPGQPTRLELALGCTRWAVRWAGPRWT